MLQLLTGTGLALAAGLTAHLPLLARGLVTRFTGLVTLPAAWMRLENGWLLRFLGGVLMIGFVADKTPARDSVHDLPHSLVRPAAGGLAFGSGSASPTVAVTDPARFFDGCAWAPVLTGVLTGVLIALTVHLAKMAPRPVLDAVTLGIGAPVASLAEDVASVLLVRSAIRVPVIVVLAAPAQIFAVVLPVRVLRRRCGIRLRSSPSAPRLRGSEAGRYALERMPHPTPAPARQRARRLDRPARPPADPPTRRPASSFRAGCCRAPPATFIIQDRARTGAAGVADEYGREGHPLSRCPSS